MNEEDFNAFLAAALAEGRAPISAGGPPLRELVSPAFSAAAVAEGTMSISAGHRPDTEASRSTELPPVTSER